MYCIIYIICIIFESVRARRVAYNYNYKLNTCAGVGAGARCVRVGERYVRGACTCLLLCACFFACARVRVPVCIREHACAFLHDYLF